MTPLSYHELRMDDDAYQNRQDPAVTVGYDITTEAPVNGQSLQGAKLLVWTTTPWTLPTNAALAVGPEIAYAVVPAGPGGAADGGSAGSDSTLPAHYMLAADTVAGEDLGADHLVGVVGGPAHDRDASSDVDVAHCMQRGVGSP